MIACPVFEVFYGGARGGGKTDGMLGDWLEHSATYGEAAVGVFFRRTYKQLSEVIARSTQLFSKIGATWNGERAEWKMPGGARLLFRHLERDEDAENYQGHNYCIATTTPIAMKDGSFKPIREIRVGDEVQTLLGPRLVTRVVPPFWAPCVTSELRSSYGSLLARQVQSIWHPLASSAAVSGTHRHEIPHTEQRSNREIRGDNKPHSKSLLYERPNSPGWLSWGERNQNACTEFERELRAERPPAKRSFRAVLHEPSLRSALEHARSSGVTSGYQHSLEGFSSTLCGKFQGWIRRLLDLRLLPALFQSIRDFAFPVFPNALSYAVIGTRRASDFPVDCPNGHDSRDAHVPTCRGNGLGRLQQQDDAEKQPRVWMRDALGTIPAHNQIPDALSMAHPYTGEAMRLSEAVTTAQVDLVPYGWALVTDITVDDANHYITWGGLVSSNSRVYIEECTNFPSAAPINKLRATIRSTVPGLKVGMRLTGNPGGPGHAWVKRRYIDPAPEGYKILSEEFTNPWTKAKISIERVFIPAKLLDNKLLMDGQPMYVAQLQQTGSQQLVEAWLLGKWDMIAGAFFTEFDPERHVLPSSWLSRVPPHSLMFRAFDWGFAKPFSVGWYVVSDGTWGLPSGALLLIREWYGCTGTPNEGVRLDAHIVARGIKATDRDLLNDHGLRLRYGVADPAIFIRDGGPSIAETMYTHGVMWNRADNKREPGWQQIRHRLNGGPDGQPRLYFLESCSDMIRTLPVLQHATRATHQEDLDTEGEDHAANQLRYACMSRPWTVLATPGEDEIRFPKNPGEMTFNELLARNRSKRLSEQAGGLGV